MKNKLVTWLDITVILLILMASAVLILFGLFKDNGKKAVVTVDEEIVLELFLSKDAEHKIETDNGFNIITVDNGGVFVSDADCKDSVCIKRGIINKKGESIVCLPHKLIVEIK